MAEQPPAAAALAALDVRYVAQRTLRDVVALAIRSGKKSQPINAELVDALFARLIGTRGRRLRIAQSESWSEI